MFSITTGISSEHLGQIDQELFELNDFLLNVLCLEQATPFLFKLERWNHLLHNRRPLFCAWSFLTKFSTNVLYTYRHQQGRRNGGA